MIRVQIPPLVPTQRKPRVSWYPANSHSPAGWLVVDRHGIPAALLTVWSDAIDLALFIGGPA